MLNLLFTGCELCYQSDIIVGRMLCERMMHQSQSSTFFKLVYVIKNLANKKTKKKQKTKNTVTDNWNMLNIGPIISLSLRRIAKNTMRCSC